MEVTLLTRIVAIVGLLVMGLLMTVQLVAVIKPRGKWTIENVYGGDPDDTDPTAYFAFYQGFAWVDVFAWGPIQLVGSLGMLSGHRWGFIAGLIASVPFWYSAIPFFFWDRDLGFRKNTLAYWVFTWGMFPAYGVVETIYCCVRLME